MPAYKDELSVDDRWAVIAYQHSLSEHTGPHVAAEHPEMEGGLQPHPEPRGVSFSTQWVTRDHRWQPRGPWKWTVMRELPQLYREFNGIDFGHAHLAETLLRTQDPQQVEKARREVLEFIFSSPAVPPDEEQVAPTFNRLAWEVARTFDWTHIFHRSLYDLFASDKVKDKEAAYKRLLTDYLEKPEAITPHRLDHHGALWSFPESKSFRDRFRQFNTQIWAYHWLQAAVYDVQLMGDLKTQQALMPKVIAFYHGYLRRPPVEWQFMPMMPEAAPEFAKRFPAAATQGRLRHSSARTPRAIADSPGRHTYQQNRLARMQRGHVMLTREVLVVVPVSDDALRRIATVDRCLHVVDARGWFDVELRETWPPWTVTSSSSSSMER